MITYVDLHILKIPQEQLQTSEKTRLKGRLHELKKGRFQRQQTVQLTTYIRDRNRSLKQALFKLMQTLPLYMISR